MNAVTPMLAGDAPVSAATSDAALLLLCDAIQKIRTEWQRRNAAANAEVQGEEPGPDLQACLIYEDKVWPGYDIPAADCLIRRLSAARPVTEAGRRARACEALFLHEMWMSNECPHPQLAELVRLVLTEAAGLTGEDWS